MQPCSANVKVSCERWQVRLLALLIAPAPQVVAVAAGTSVLFWSCSAALAARTGGAPMLKASGRVAFWGAPAMAITALVGRLFGTAV